MSDFGSKSNSVFFSGIPLRVTEGQLRKFFAQPGKVLTLRVVAVKPGSSFQSGFIDYLDLKTAQRAVAELNGKVLGDGDTPIRVAMAHASGASKRPRPGEDRGGDAAASTDANGAVIRMEFRRGHRNLLLPGDACIEQALSQLPVSEAYEAVEQLRLLILERPDDARQLLEHNPQLAVATLLILQHAEKLPFDSLPPEALVDPHAPSTHASVPSTSATLSSSTASETPATATPAAVNKDFEKVLKAIENMSAEQVEKIVKMTPAQIEAIPNESSRKQIAYLQKQLKLMDSA
mmetsp:Transcript_38308/g.44636  ORF Transcript_38308/g.44636 Transcript_38308/m.44636 type:complete len:291 (+) Transcript_38308:57-929(+)|eukprot:CAMPEP_0176454048 /NCGR_PEP_ID=MMETSP0127-20121128/29680_1 /TAXON_ID=938130 /ORGANISM="Platyophrya macrostoma, Strain WH" /LENGTH=290 /DNA_ID=CAMNT_0017843181 /DNA_START=52 /DNA_END=927 /DNA_ORIENTATION=-